ncbi:uncharacterized protein LOC107272434 [Cephus cinctus]|uniref:pyridoxal 5'-phosphate synthase n=1 Tax=Cephus cinctus TaxID=211228 RepID=A0AAJ7C9H8_CEPCN|nr:uncharacterized protein LOC107272434 [Cephus cinctus]
MHVRGVFEKGCGAALMILRIIQTLDVPRTRSYSSSSSRSNNNPSYYSKQKQASSAMDTWDERTPHSELSDLAFIEVKSDDPLVLFREWYEEARQFSTGLPNALCLATVSRDQKVSARHVILRQLDEDGFDIVTDKRSRKAQDLDEVPSAAMCFLWSYLNDRNEHIARQVRLEGTIKKLSKEESQKFYDREPLFCKIRSHLCQQGHEVDWKKLKERHDQIVKEVMSGENSLPMPEHFTAYKLKPVMIEFYFAKDHLIGDRVLFTRDTSADPWKHCKIAA